ARLDRESAEKRLFTGAFVGAGEGARTLDPDLGKAGTLPPKLLPFIAFPILLCSFAQELPGSLQFRHRKRAMLSADGGIALHHAQRRPAAFLFDGLQVDSGLDAFAGPMVTPVVDSEIGDLRSLAGRGVGLLDRSAARELVLARIAVGLAALREEY